MSALTTWVALPTRGTAEVVEVIKYYETRYDGLGAEVLLADGSLRFRYARELILPTGGVS